MEVKQTYHSLALTEKTVTITADGSSVAGTILEVDDDGVTVDITQV